MHWYIWNTSIRQMSVIKRSWCNAQVSVIFACKNMLDCIIVKTCIDRIIEVSKGAKIRNRYNQVPYLTQDTNGKVTNSQHYITKERQEVSPFPAGDHKAQINRRAHMHNKHNRKKITLKTHKRTNITEFKFQEVFWVGTC